mgnify:FL=1
MNEPLIAVKDQFISLSKLSSDQKNLINFLEDCLRAVIEEEKVVNLILQDYPFEKVGIDSLAVEMVLSEIEERLNLNITLNREVLIIHDTISKLALYIQQNIEQSIQQKHISHPLALEDKKKFTDFTLMPGYIELKHQKNYLKTFQSENVFFQEGEGHSGSEIVFSNKKYINYSGYNYLGLAHDPDIIIKVKQAIDQYGTSVSASRLVGGNKILHTLLEQKIAAFLGTENALVFSAGHATNVNTITYLMGPKDVIFYDALSHNSLIQGAVFSGASRFSYAHNNPEHLAELLYTYRSQYERALIVTEGVFSMDGDIPPVPTLIELKKKYDCWLMIDEAHSLGTIGKQGKGVCDYFNVRANDIDILMGTLSKSLASCGGYIAGSQALIDNLKYKSPGFIFSAGISPANTAAALYSLEKIEEESWRVRKLQQNSELLLEQLKLLGLDTGLSHHAPVIPVIMNNEKTILQLSLNLKNDGIFAMPIIYPAVPRNLSRIRFFVNSSHTSNDIIKTTECLHKHLLFLKG